MSWWGALIQVGASLYNNRQKKKGSKSSGTEFLDRESTSTRGRVSVEDFLTDQLSNFRPRSTFSLAQESQDVAALHTKEAVDSLFADYQEQAIPQILNNASTSGTYSGTTEQMLANDAYARTVADAASLRLGYGSSLLQGALSQQSQEQDLLTQLFQIDLNQYSESEEETEGSKNAFASGANTGIDQNAINGLISALSSMGGSSGGKMNTNN